MDCSKTKRCNQTVDRPSMYTRCTSFGLCDVPVAYPAPLARRPAPVTSRQPQRDDGGPTPRGATAHKESGAPAAGQAPRLGRTKEQRGWTQTEADRARAKAA